MKGSVLRIGSLLLLGSLFIVSSLSSAQALDSSIQNTVNQMNSAPQPTQSCVPSAIAADASFMVRGQAAFMESCVTTSACYQSNSAAATLQCQQAWEAQCLSAACGYPDCKEKATTACPSDKGAAAPPDRGADAPGDGTLKADPIAKKPASTTPSTKPASTTASTTTPGASPASTGGTTTPATGNASTDLQTCQALQAQAYSFCNNPQTTATTPTAATTSGMNANFAQMQAAAAANANANLQAGGQCYQKYTSCVNTCNQLASSYSDQTATNLRAMASSCQQLQSKATTMGQQSVASNDASMMSALGQALSGMGQSQPQDNSDPYGCAQNPTSAACVQCSQNPASPACQALAQSTQPETGQAGFKDNNAQPQGGFNLPDAASSLPDTSTVPPAQAATPPTVGTVANNTGGGVPAGNSSSPAPQLNDPAAPQGSPGAPGYTTQIDEGFRSSGYSQPAGVGPGEASSGTNTRYGRNLASTGMGARLDLKQYLPGGRLDPSRGRGLAGLSGAEAHIHGRFVDLWSRISDKIQEKCRLGELLDCR